MKSTRKLLCDFFFRPRANFRSRAHDKFYGTPTTRPPLFVYNIHLNIYVSVCVRARMCIVLLFQPSQPRCGVANLHRTKPPNGHWKQFSVCVYVFFCHALAHTRTHTEDKRVADVILKLLR